MGTFGDARGTKGACRADFVMLARLVVDVPVATVLAKSTSDDSGVVRREVVVLKDGRRSDVNEGEGGRGSGGRL